MRSLCFFLIILPTIVFASGKSLDLPSVNPANDRFPIYPIVGYCKTQREGMCEEKQQATYDKSRFYWDYMSTEHKLAAKRCASAKNYVNLLHCIEVGFAQQEMEDEIRRAKQPFHY